LEADLRRRNLGGWRILGQGLGTIYLPVQDYLTIFSGNNNSCVLNISPITYCETGPGTNAFLGKCG
jgi:hypothetical protein